MNKRDIRGSRFGCAVGILFRRPLQVPMALLKKQFKFVVESPLSGTTWRYDMLAASEVGASSFKYLGIREVRFQLLPIT